MVKKGLTYTIPKTIISNRQISYLAKKVFILYYSLDSVCTPSKQAKESLPSCLYAMYRYQIDHLECISAVHVHIIVQQRCNGFILVYFAFYMHYEFFHTVTVNRKWRTGLLHVYRQGSISFSIVTRCQYSNWHQISKHLSNVK